jgi:hypothetical protein
MSGWGALLAGVVLLSGGAKAHADMAAPPPVAGRVAAADCVVVGKVAALEEKPAFAAAFPGAPQKNEYRIAVVTIKERLVGARGLTSVRVSFHPVQGNNYKRRFYQVNLKAGQHVCLLLRRHFEENFYLATNYYDVLVLPQQGVLQELNQIRQYAGLLARPEAGLKSKTAEERFLTAALLITRYRNSRRFAGQKVQTEAIDARQSQRLLAVLAEVDWNKPRAFGEISPQQVFFQLGLTKQDGWDPPQVVQSANEIANAARAWLKKHGDSYRIKRFVAGKRGKK